MGLAWEPRQLRHRPSAPRRLARAGLHTPVPGVSSRAVPPPENTAQLSYIRVRGGPAPVNVQFAWSQNRPAPLPAFSQSPAFVKWQTGRHVATRRPVCHLSDISKEVRTILIRIEKIIISPNRREANPDYVRELADSIAELGMMNAITIGRDFVLIAGLHRLEAAKLLSWTEIECNILDLDGLLAELAEIDENFVRNDIPTVDHNDMVLRRKEIYEALHPSTKNGGDRRSAKAVEENRSAKCTSDPHKSFTQDTADKMGVDASTVRRQVQAAKNTTEEAKKILRDSGTNISQKDALALSRMEPEQQKEAAAQLAAGDIKKLAEFQPEETEALPFKLESKHYGSIEESIADMKDPNKDCSATPDMFLAEITCFAQKLRGEIAWYGNEYYHAAFPLLTRRQMDYLREQIEAICSQAEELYDLIERIREYELSKKA